MHSISIRDIESLNHNVRRIVTEKPGDYSFQPGQATLVAIDRKDMREDKHPFTFTSLPGDDFLEFTIKIYPGHEGLTAAIERLQAGDRLLIEDPWGAITFKGPGTFIAGGAGLTPFLAILRNQGKNSESQPNRLLFSNHTANDLFLKEELEQLTDGNLLLTFTEEKVPGSEYGRIDLAFLKKHTENSGQNFYVCGPPDMVDSVTNDLKILGVASEKIVTEES